MPRRHNQKGRSKAERFVSLPHFMLDSPAYGSLSPVGRAVLVEIAKRFNGVNNGRIALSARDAAKRVNCSKDTAARAIRELIEKGFIECSAEGKFDRKIRHASEYRLTLYSCDRTGKLPSRAFMRWQNDKPEIYNQSDHRDGRSDCRDESQPDERKLRVLSLSSDRDAEIPSLNGPTRGTHIVYHGDGDEERQRVG